MAKTKKQKESLVKEYKKKLEDSKAIVILKYKGVTPNEAVELKKKLFEVNSSFNVVKNTLFKIALKDLGFAEEEDLNNLEHSVVFIKEDIANGAKILKQFIGETKDKEGNLKFEIVSGYFDKSKLSQEQVKELADLPTFEGSISLILGILDNALSSIVNVLEDPVRSYATILEQAFKAEDKA